MRAAAVSVGLALAACAAEPPTAPRPGDTGGGATDGSDDGSDGAADGASDGADATDSAGADTGEPAPCALGLQITTDAGALDSGAVLALGDGRAWADRLHATLTLHNPCDTELRFLGHPEEWVTGDRFGLADLPPVLLEPGASAALTISFSPGEEGAYDGSFSLPHDQPGSPFTATLSAAVGPPLTLVFVGEGRRVSTTTDYGATWALDAWETVEAHTDALQRGGCAGDGVFVSVGGSGESRWWTSADGVSWTAHADPAGAWMADCAHGDLGFVALAGAPHHSPDGETWTPGSVAYNPAHLRTAAASGAVVVAAGDGGRVAVTEDGASWAVDGAPLSASVRVLAARDGVFVAGGESGLLAASFDGGRAWSEAWVGSSAWSHVVATEAGFIAGNGASVYSSVDGTGWSLVNASTVRPLVAVGAMLFGADGAALSRSDDGGFTWVEIRPDDGGPGYSDAMVGG